MRGFETDYDGRLRNLIERRTAPAELTTNRLRMSRADSSSDVYTASPIYEVYNNLGREGSAVKYLVGSMAKVDPKYTEITYAQGERVRNQLEKALNALNAPCEFEYQGSVTNDTHIKSHSDIDLLAITRRFSTLEPPQKATYPYHGNPTADLMEVRSISSRTLHTAFPAGEVDDSGSTCVAISGGSLQRKIDVVPANWYDTNQYSVHRAKRFRAIQVLNSKTGERNKNMPFMHNYLIDLRDTRTQGGLRRIVRLMKSLKYDSQNVTLTSYDLTAIAYSMSDFDLATHPGGELALLCRLKAYLDELAIDSTRRASMLVPDQSRRVFIEGHATLNGLQELQTEVDDLVDAVSRNLQKSFTRLQEAKIAY